MSLSLQLLPLLLIPIRLIDFYSICRNILALTNHFHISDQNITLVNYDKWVEYLDTTYPDEVGSLQLRVCELQRFLDQVL